jgi:hypothetical protein
VAFPQVEATAYFDFWSLTDSDRRPGFVTKAWCSFFSSSPTASLRLCRFKDDPADRNLLQKPGSKVFFLSTLLVISAIPNRSYMDL